MGDRETFSGYFEASIDLSMEILRNRGKKNLYARAFNGKIKNVVGVDLWLSRPTVPDMVIDNSEDGADLSAIAAQVLARATGIRATD
ncbi:MAG: adenylyl-sulfate kinase [Proteobacteria bacterium]|nr:adenylyl-sulfate kinase [Pseudomonadota bacterium]